MLAAHRRVLPTLSLTLLCAWSQALTALGQEPDAAASSAALATGQPLELSLEAALDLARANNLELQRSTLESEGARYDLLGSWGAFEWVFDGRFTFSESEFEPTIIFEGQGGSVDTTSTNWHFDLTRPLTTGGRFQFSFDGDTQDSTSGVRTFEKSSTDIITLAYVQPFRRGAWEKYATSSQRELELVYRSQLERERTARHRVLLAVHNAYWDLVAAMEQRAVASSALDLGNEQLQQNQRRLDAGVGTEVEVLQAQTEVATRFEALIQRETAVDQAMDDLRALLFPRQDQSQGELWEHVVLPVTALPERAQEVPLPPVEQALVQALELRPDLAQLRLDIERNKLRHSRALSDRLAGVDLSLSASGRGLDTDFDDAAGEAAGFDFPSYSAILSYNMPIGNKTADYAARRTRNDIRLANIALEQGETDAMAGVRRSLRDVEYQGEAVRAAEQSLELARRQLEAEEARYAADLSTNFQVLQFQQSLIEADSNLRRIRVALVKSEAALRHALGTIDEREAQR